MAPEADAPTPVEVTTATPATPTAPTQPPTTHAPAPAPATISQYALPMSVVGPVDVGRLTRELEALDGALMQLSLRGGGSEVKMPKTTQMMDQFAQLNKLNLLLPDQRKQVLQYLEAIHAHAPLLHMSFSADPSPAFIEKLMAWLRNNVHPQVLLTIGLQPNIGAGCIIRSTNKYFDCSLRQNFVKQRSSLASKLFPDVGQLASTVVPTAAQPVAPAMATETLAQGVTP